jgi:hypothetical protein
VQENFLKISLSVTALVVFGVGTFTFLYTHRGQFPDAAMRESLYVADLQGAMRAAQKLMDRGEYQAAADRLEAPIKHAAEGPDRTDARFLRAEARYRALGDTFTDKQAEPNLAEIGELVDLAREHPLAMEALRWKAGIYERSNMLYGARDVYDAILSEFKTSPALDEILMDASKVSERLGQP